MPDRLFRDRRDAGRVLAGLLDHYRNQPEVIVLGLPRGGVPVGYDISRALGAPLDVFVVVDFTTPPNTTYVGLSAPGLTCTQPAAGSTGPLSCNVGTLAPNVGGSITATPPARCTACTM